MSELILHDDANERKHEIADADGAPIAYKGQPVMTTERLAAAFGSDAKNILMNQARNPDHFTEGEHFFKLTGAALEDLRATVSGLQISPKARALILWTKHGAMHHAKILDSKEAWALYGQLVATYFAVQDGRLSIPEQPKKPVLIRPRASEVRATNLLLKTVLGALPNLGEESKQALISTISSSLLGVQLLPAPTVERSWTTTELALECGLSPQGLGRKLNEDGMKRPEFGTYRLSKSQHSDKQVEQFHWNERGRSAVLAVYGRIQGEA